MLYLVLYPGVGLDGSQLPLLPPLPPCRLPAGARHSSRLLTVRPPEHARPPELEHPVTAQNSAALNQRAIVMNGSK